MSNKIQRGDAEARSKKQLSVSLAVTVDLLWEQPLFATIKVNGIQYLLCRSSAEKLLGELKAFARSKGGNKLVSVLTKALSTPRLRDSAVNKNSVRSKPSTKIKS